MTKVKSRALLLADIVQIKGNLNSLKTELDKYPWDSEIALITVSKGDFTYLINRAIAGDITFETVEEWANILECRDDVAYENQMMEDIIFELANPYLNGEITKGKLEEILDILQGSKLI
ncbi:hypothetical protein [Dyadobacter luticola]|nr:hypothetical protein [Dyadobacter luticola]